MACCCCVEDVDVTYKKYGPKDNPKAPSHFGHYVDFIAKMSYQSPATPCHCSLSWEEKVTITTPNNFFYYLWTKKTHTTTVSKWEDGAKEFEDGIPWQNSGNLTLRHWYRRRNQAPCPGAFSNYVNDIPGIKARGTKHRVLEIKITVKSCPGCSCAKTQGFIHIKQVLGIKAGKITAQTCNIVDKKVT